MLQPDPRHAVSTLSGEFPRPKATPGRPGRRLLLGLGGKPIVCPGGDSHIADPAVAQPSAVARNLFVHVKPIAGLLRPLRSRKGIRMRVSVVLAASAVSFILLSPASAEAQGDVDRCRFAGDLKQADEGIAACDRVLSDSKLTPQNRAAALSNRCGWWWAKKDPDRALPDCNEAVRTDSSNVSALLNRGNVFMSKSDSDHALNDFNSAIKLDPNSAWAYAARGNLYRYKGDFEYALADMNDAIRLDPSYALAFFWRGEIYKNKGDFNRAASDVDEALKLDPNLAPAYFTRGQLSYILGNNPAAIEDFGKTIKLDANDAASYFYRGVAYYVVGGHYPDAVADLKKAADFNPKDAYAALWRDLAERRNNAPSHLEEAAKQLDLTAWPAPIIRHFLGELSVEQTVAAANAPDPKTKQAQTCEAHFYSGELALLKKNKKEAQHLLKLAADQCPPGFVETTATIADLIVLNARGLQLDKR
jgi:lipoprotein NlpI